MSDEVRALEDYYFRLMDLHGAPHVYREAVRSGVLDILRAVPFDAETDGATNRSAEARLTRGGAPHAKELDCTPGRAPCTPSRAVASYGSARATTKW